MDQYAGQIVPIELGAGGLFTDAPNSRCPHTKLKRATNVTLANGVAEKDFGSMQWNRTVMPGKVLHFKDYWPTPDNQRVIAFCDDGKTYRHQDLETYAELTPASSAAPTTLGFSSFISMVEGGQEETGNDKKLFIMNGVDTVQVLEGDSLTRRNITSPSADWSASNQPYGAVVHRSRLFAFGYSPHLMTASDPANHENFASNHLNFSIYPGEGHRIVAAFVFKTRLFVVKYPRYVYFLVDDDADSDNWYFSKYSGTIGGTSPHGFCEVLDDILIGNSQGSLTGLRAVNNFADFESANLFNKLGVKKFMTEEIQPSAYLRRSAYYYESKQTVFFAFQGPSRTSNNRICQVSYRIPEAPEITWNDKDQANYIGGLIGADGIERPAYAADDGFIYVMDSPNKWVGDAAGVTRTGYLFEIVTPHLDFTWLSNGAFGDQLKNFEFLEVTFIPTGKHDLNIDVFQDGRYVGTKKVSLDDQQQLDSMRLDQFRFSDGVEASKIIALGGQAKRIAFRCYNENAGEDVQLVRLNVYFKPVGPGASKRKG